MIGLTELAVRRFPALDAKGIVQTIHEKLQRHEPRPVLVRNAQPVVQVGKHMALEYPGLFLPMLLRAIKKEVSLTILSHQ